MTGLGGAPPSRSHPRWNALELYPPRPVDEDRLFHHAPTPVWVLMGRKPFAPAVTVPCGDVDQHPFHGRVRVEYGDGSRYHVRPSRLVPRYAWSAAVSSMNPEMEEVRAAAVGEPLAQEEAEDHLSRSGPRKPSGEQHSCVTVVCAETPFYRRLARTLPRASDFVLEIGCDMGGATRCLAEACVEGRVVAVDKSRSHVDEARRLHPCPRVSFHCLDLFNESLAVRTLGPFDAAFIDINGSRALPAVLRAVASVRDMFPGLRLVVVKSAQLDARLRSGDSEDFNGMGCDFRGLPEGHTIVRTGSELPGGEAAGKAHGDVEDHLKDVHGPTTEAPNRVNLERSADAASA